MWRVQKLSFYFCRLKKARTVRAHFLQPQNSVTSWFAYFTKFVWFCRHFLRCKQIQILRSARANSQGQKKPLSNTLERKKGFSTHVFLSEISMVEISVTVENSDEVERAYPTENGGSQRFHVALWLFFTKTTLFNICWPLWTKFIW